MAEYRHTAQATFDLKYHVLWITKYRYKILRGRIAERARELIRQVCPAREVVNHPRSGITGPYPYAAVGCAASGTGKTGAVHPRPVVAKVARGIPGVAQAVLGPPLWARGYLCATVGAVDEPTIQANIEKQKWDEDDQGFKITAPREP